MPSSGRKPIAKSSSIRDSQEGINSADGSCGDARSDITSSTDGADTPVTYYMGSPLLVLPVEDGYKNIAHLANTGKYLTKNNLVFFSEILEHIFYVVHQMRPA